METISTVLIDIVFPITVLGACIWLYRYMRRSGVEKPPYLRLFILIASYASIIWFTLGFYFTSTGVSEYTIAPLIFIVSPLIIVIAFLSYAQKKESTFHRVAYVTSIYYVFAFVMLIYLLSSRCPPYRGGPP